MLFISDVHVSTNEIMNINTNQIFEAIINELQVINDEYVIFLGDNVQYASEKEYDLFFSYLTKLKDKKIYILSGNHDSKERLEKYAQKNKVIFCLDNDFAIDNNQYYFLDTVISA